MVDLQRLNAMTESPTLPVVRRHRHRPQAWLVSGFAFAIAVAPARGQGPVLGTTAPASIDFLVVSPDGLPVADIKAEEVSLKIDGRPRAVRSLRFVQIGDGTGTAPGVDPSVPPPFGSNAQDQTVWRSLVLVLDDDSFRVGTERPLREAADRFLAGLAPSDRVALVTMPYGGTKVSLTTDREKVRAALAQIIGQAPQSESPAEAACRTRRTLESLVGLFEGLETPSPPIVLFFSASLVGPTDSNMRIATGLGGPAGTNMCEVPRETFQQVGNAASTVGARVYIIQPTTIQSQVAGLENVAGVTGGTMMHLGGSDSNALSRVARETAAYYVADFDIDSSMRTGAARRVELRVSRSGASVRVRPTLTIAKDRPRRSMSPRDLLRQAGAFTDIPVRVSGLSSREPGEKTIRVVLLGEVADPSIKITGAAAGLFDEKGRLAAQWTAKPEEIAAGLLVGALTVPPGPYRLRLAATDASGGMGTADYELTAELTPAGPLQLSALALGTSRGTFVPKLQFGSEPVAVAHVEIYGGKPGMPVSALFEVARSLNGPAIATVPGALGAVGNHHAASGAIPIGNLPAGDYVVRAIIGVEGQAAGRVVRTLRKVGGG